MLGKFEQNRMVQTTRYFELFDKKKQKTKNKKKKIKQKRFFKPFWQSVGSIMEDVSVGPLSLNGIK